MSDPSPPKSPAHGGFNVSRWSIEHPYVVIAFYLGVVALAIMAVVGYMPRRFAPYVPSPMLGVVSMMPGLSAEEMETYISKPIEERMVNIPGVRFVRSTSQDGYSIVTLEFPYQTDMDKALAQTQALLNVIQADLPATGANLKPSWVLKIDPLNLPVLSLSLTGDEHWDMARLRELADNEITNRLKSVSSQIYTVQMFGGYRRQMQVIVDRNRLAAYGLSILQIRNAIDANNVAKPAGTLTTGDSETILRVDTLGRDPATVGNYPISSVDGRVVYVKDVARVVDTYYEPRSGFHHLYRRRASNGSDAGAKIDEAIEINVLQAPDASSPVVVGAVMAEVKRLEQRYPGIHFRTAYDNSAFVGILLKNMFEELGIAVLLTGIAVLLFLGNWRGTVVAMTAIPVSISMALLALIPLGMTLNSSTLIGLLLSIGRLVDDAIIDVHAVERHLRMGKDPTTATIDGITEVRTSVAASTLMLCLALLPLVFSGGIVQDMFVGLVWPIIFGLLASFLVSLTLTSLMAARLLVPHTDPRYVREANTWLYRTALNPVQRGLEWLERGYARLIGWLLKNRMANLARVLATIIVGFGFYYFIGSEMMPLADVGQAYMTLEMQPGTSFAATDRATRWLERIIANYPEVRNASIELGYEGGPGYSTGAYFNGYSMGLVNGASGMLTLSDKDARKRDIWQVMDGIVAQARATIPDIRRLQIKEMGSDVMASSAAPIQLLVYGTDLKVTSALAEQVAAIMRKVPDAYQVATSWEMGQPSYALHIDPRRALEQGLTVSDVADQAYHAMRGGFANEFFRPDNLRQTTVLVRYERDERSTPADLLQMTLTSPDGRQVPLKSVATLEYREAPTLIEHDNFRRVVSVMGFYRKAAYQPPGADPRRRVTNRPSMDVAMEVMMKAQSQLNWPPGYGIEMRGDMTQMMDSFRRLLNGLKLALVFILLVLVAQFRGFLQPAQMIFSLPLELSGVFVALWLAGQTFSTVSILGIIVLTGMDITAAILLLDLIVRYRASGMPRNKAVIAACPERLRPILMTSFITIVAMAPVAFAPKTGMDAYQPLGTVVIGGLLIGTVLTLVDIPIMHTLVDDVIRWWLVHGRGRDPRSLPPIE